MRMFRSPAFWVGVIMLTVAMIANMTDHGSLMRGTSVSAEDRPTLSQMASEAALLREGTALTDLKGRFRKQVDRLVFVEDGTNRSYKCLENLCLQRVASSLQDEDRKLVWLISAKATEFNEENFLILDKAMRTR